MLWVVRALAVSIGIRSIPRHWARMARRGSVPFPTRLRLMLFVMLIQHQNTMRWQVIISLEAGASQEIVDRLVELQPDARILVVQHKIDFGVFFLAETHLDGVRG